MPTYDVSSRFLAAEGLTDSALEAYQERVRGIDLRIRSLAQFQGSQRCWVPVSKESTAVGAYLNCGMAASYRFSELLKNGA